MNVDSWLKMAKKQIDALDAEIIAVRNFAPRGRDRSWLAAHADEQISEGQCVSAMRMLDRRQNGVPMAYILGEKEFYGRNFYVSSAVLIPRPETESLINLVKGLDLPKKSRFLEIGTGSGCIAVTLALEFPQSYVLATDISVRALDVAERNSIYHEGRIELVQSNLLRDIEFDTEGEDLPEHFDVVVANLPYVNRDWEWLKTDTLNYEPSGALYAKSNNGLSIYQRFLKELRYYRNRDEILMDYLVVEADPCQHAALIKMAEKAGMFYQKTEGYGLVFEDGWRYWYDYREKWLRA